MRHSSSGATLSVGATGKFMRLAAIRRLEYSFLVLNIFEFKKVKVFLRTCWDFGGAVDSFTHQKLVFPKRWEFFTPTDHASSATAFGSKAKCFMFFSLFSCRLHKRNVFFRHLSHFLAVCQTENDEHKALTMLLQHVLLCMFDASFDRAYWAGQ